LFLQQVFSLFIVLTVSDKTDQKGLDYFYQAPGNQLYVQLKLFRVKQ